MSLLADLENLASSLTPSELPHNESVQQTVGAIVKVLEHQGVTVAEDLLPAATAAGLAPEAEAAAAAIGAAPEAVTALHDLLARAEQAVSALEHRSSSEPPAAPSTGESPASSTAPVEPPVEGAQ